MNAHCFGCVSRILLSFVPCFFLEILENFTYIVGFRPNNIHESLPSVRKGAKLQSLCLLVSYS